MLDPGPTFLATDRAFRLHCHPVAQGEKPVNHKNKGCCLAVLLLSAACGGGEAFVIETANRTWAAMQ